MSIHFPFHFSLVGILAVFFCATARQVENLVRGPGSVILAGPSFAYFHYDEEFSYPDLLELHDVDTIEGIPKSTEYGANLGMCMAFGRFSRMAPIFVRPELKLISGIYNIYDGSSLDTSAVGVKYNPLAFYKKNRFLTAGFDIGYYRLRPRRGLRLYTGLQVNIWNRAFGRSMSEDYYWLNIPLGCMFDVVRNTRWALGLSGRFHVMVFGAMQLYLAPELHTPGGRSYDEIYAPSVRLENRSGFRVEMNVSKLPAATVGFDIIPYFEFYSFGKSNHKEIEYRSGGITLKRVEFYEPASNSWRVGTDFLMRIHPKKRR